MDGPVEERLPILLQALVDAINDLGSKLDKIQAGVEMPGFATLYFLFQQTNQPQPEGLKEFLEQDTGFTLP